MKILTHQGNILDIEADTLVLPVDGSAPGLEGHIARQFMERVGVEQMHELFAPPPYYPFNGDCYWSNIAPFADATHFRHICCLGMLSHEAGANHAGYIASSLGSMLFLAGMDPGMGEHIACPVLTGGNRVGYVDAVYLMLKVVDENRNRRVTLHIVESHPEKFEILRDIVGQS